MKNITLITIVAIAALTLMGCAVSSDRIPTLLTEHGLKNCDLGMKRGDFVLANRGILRQTVTFDNSTRHLLDNDRVVDIVWERERIAGITIWQGGSIDDISASSGFLQIAKGGDIIKSNWQE